PAQVDRLVLVDSFGLGKFRPAPRFGLAVLRYVTRPSERTYNGLMRQCTVDFDGFREELGDRWEPYQSYTLERAATPSAKAALKVIMRELAAPPIPHED